MRRKYLLIKKFRKGFRCARVHADLIANAAPIRLVYANPGSTIEVYLPGTTNGCESDHSKLLAALVSGKPVILFQEKNNCDPGKRQCISHAGIHAVTP